ncbi:hypothetical protein EVAR_92075_1 [Eumeta japonica]|uniref:Uncharacterized protein n=1 Tax=Eumeta variegata TaxID=151549 RepID=A0A4C1SYA0_EUMVA|nr:hypothetical protein EVAR_92075_1 [Eumeta japonica]
MGGRGCDTPHFTHDAVSTLAENALYKNARRPIARRLSPTPSGEGSIKGQFLKFHKCVHEVYAGGPLIDWAFVARPPRPILRKHFFGCRGAFCFPVRHYL